MADLYVQKLSSHQELLPCLCLFFILCLSAVAAIIAHNLLPQRCSRDVSSRSSRVIRARGSGDVLWAEPRTAT